MDKITINQNVFIEVQDKAASGSGSDITIIPLEINLEFLARHRVGPKLKFGTTQEVKLEYINNTVEMRDC
jgi:hypothetical protein